MPASVPGRSSLHVGLIGGLGIEAAVVYYRAIASACARRGVIPRVTITHAHAPTVLRHAAAGRVDELADCLAVFVDDLGRAGADLVAIPAVTPHLALGALRARGGPPIIDILAVTDDGLRAKGASRVALFGTRTTIESELFGALADREVIAPTPDEVEEIDRVYVELASTGRASAANVDAMRRIAETVHRRDRVDAIVLAGTDLHIILDELGDAVPVFDCTSAHIEAIVDQATRAGHAGASGAPVR